MSSAENIRWRQRLESFRKALAQLEAACELEEYSELERAGLVQMFAFSFELAWKTLKDKLFYDGFDEKTPRSVVRRSFEAAYLSEEDSEILLDALRRRNLLAHTYDEDVAERAVKLIKETYFPVLKRACSKLQDTDDA